MEARRRRRGVEGVVLDLSLFNDITSSSAITHAEKLLHRLSFSNMRLGILFRNAINNESCILQKERVERCMPTGPGHVFDSKSASDECLSEVLKDFCISWELSMAQCIFLTPCLELSQKRELTNQGWHICLLSDYTHLKQLGVDKTAYQFQELYHQIACINKEVGEQVIVIGYSMKWSREMDFLKRGALPLHITSKNLCFSPLNLELSLSQQLETLDVMLHKPTDEITNVAFGEVGSLQDQITFADATQQSFRYLSSHPQICVVDPIERILPLLDRVLTQEILQGLSSLEHQSSRRIRAPRYKRVEKLEKFNPLEVLKDSNLSLPVIIKPQIACGISDAHIMAVVFKNEGFFNLAVPVPSTIQEYIDHGSMLYKFYVIGESVSYSVRRSMPNTAKLMESVSDSNLPASIIFDSLKSLPKHFVKDENATSDHLLPASEEDRLDLPLVCAAATWLREKLKLTIFGFDVVIQVHTNDHVIIDVNFFPTFKDVDEHKAIPAFWDALSKAYTRHKELCALQL